MILNLFLFFVFSHNFQLFTCISSQIRAEKPLFSSNPELDNLVSAKIIIILYLPPRIIIYNF